MIRIDNKKIGENEPVYIIAEISANHCGDEKTAKKMISSAKNAGADAVKIQTYTADTLTLDCKNDYFKIKDDSLWKGKYLYELYHEAFTPWEWQEDLKKYADKIGITLFSTPFDRTATDFLEKIGVEAYKIASFEAIDLDLIEYVARLHKPMLISTGISSKEEIRKAIETCKSQGNDQIILLKCTSNYPSNIEDMNLLTMPDMKKEFKVEVGLSDHSMNIETPVAAVALGAKVIEKHFILDRNMGGPDAEFSLTIDEFKQMVQSVRNTEKALGKIGYTINVNSRNYARSLFCIENIKEGEMLTRENIGSIRPGMGLHPRYIKEVLGKRASRNIEKGTPLSWDLVK
jgi:pseudaminic acid synthase